MTMEKREIAELIKECKRHLYELAQMKAWHKADELRHKMRLLKKKLREMP